MKDSGKLAIKGKCPSPKLLALKISQENISPITVSKP